MADWSQEKARRARQYLLNNASVRLDHDRHILRENRELNRHADTVNTWIVGLSTGAMGLMMTGFTKLTSIPRWQAVFAFTPFVVSIFSGLLFRWALKETESAEAFSSASKQSGLIDLMLRLPTLTSEDELEGARQRLERIAKELDGGQLKLNTTARYWANWANRIYWIPSISFVIGVLALVVLALIRWESPVIELSPASIPQMRQSKP